ncbi:hypothetical protein TVAGG3_0516440 [Trichomonas vaginalis G3]|uniref:hypothetical protein n=1 Tax=Trichomonas vaginalis (strain ATCC PRA-98 / G3) TaxID=412133 RepID=UPI0021E57EC5|nr:hypothetical protein TVAGG3_0516440 [Trichomonas vaginalis G3]KAI5518166.1 hypothetical protein TVAGG3_0516440 [Trichomonas vaginalis G3]
MNEKLINFVEVTDEFVDDAKNPIELTCSSSPQEMAKFILDNSEKCNNLTLVSFGINSKATKSYLSGPSSVLAEIITNLLDKSINPLLFIENSTLKLPNEENSAYVVKNPTDFPKLFENTNAFPENDYFRIKLFFSDRLITLVYLPFFPPFKSNTSIAIKTNSWQILQNPKGFITSKAFIAIHTDYKYKEETKTLKILAQNSPEILIEQFAQPQVSISLNESDKDENEEENNEIENENNNENNNENQDENKKHHHRKHRHHHHHHKPDAKNKESDKENANNKNNSVNSKPPSKKGSVNSRKSPGSAHSSQKANLSNAQNIDIESLNNSENFPEEEGFINSPQIEEEEDIEEIQKNEKEKGTKTGTLNPDGVKTNRIRKIRKTRRIKRSTLLDQANEDTEEDFEYSESENEEQNTELKNSEYSSDYDDYYDTYISENETKQLEKLKFKNEEEETATEAEEEEEETLEDKIHNFAYSVELNIPALQTNAIYATLFNQLFYEKWRGGALKRAEAALNQAKEHLRQTKADEIQNLRNLVESNDLTMFVAREERKLRLIESKSVEVMELLFSARSSQLAEQNPTSSLLKTYKIMCAENIELMRTVREKRAKIRSVAMDIRVLQMRRIEAMEKRHNKAIKMTNAKQELIKITEEKEAISDEIEGLSQAKEQLLKQREKILALIEQKKAELAKKKSK